MLDTNQKSMERFQDIIGNYETFVTELNNEICSLKSHQNDLKLQLTTVVTENTKLSQNLLSALNSAQNCQVLAPDNDQLVNNLKEQIRNLTTEKDYVTKLWQESVKTVDHLEDELKVFQAGYEEFVPKKEFLKLKKCYEEKIAELDAELGTTQKKLDETIKRAQQKIEIKHGEVDQSLENQTSALKIVKNLEIEILRLQKRLRDNAEEKSQLERLLGNKEDVIQALKKANADCLSRVTEAVGIVEAALNEKDAALFREAQIKKENEKLEQKISKIIKEYEETIESKSDKIKVEFNEKQKMLLGDLANARHEIKNKNSELEGLTKKCALLESEIERMHKGHCTVEETGINKLLVLEKNLEATFQKLLLSEKQNIQLVSEKESIKNDLEQMASIYERNLKTKEVEISTLKSTINRLKGELGDSYGQVTNITKRMSKLNEQIAKTEKELREEKEKFEKGIQTTEEKLDQIAQKYNDNIKELHSQVEKKNEINREWKSESKIITEKLEKMVTELKQETQTLRKENYMTSVKLKKAEEKSKQYKIFLELISKDVAKISHLTLGSVS